MIHVDPYPYVYTTYVKQRWLGKSLVAILTLEFKDYDELYFRDAVLIGLVYVLRKGALISQVSDVVLCDSDIIIHFTHRHESPIFSQPFSRLTELAYIDGRLCRYSDIPLERRQEAAVFNAVFKPAGMPVHPVSHYFQNSLVHQVAAKFVNRLDRLVSGLMLSAERADAAEALRQQFEGRGVIKLYGAKVLPNRRDGCYAVYGDIEYDTTNARRTSPGERFELLQSRTYADAIKAAGHQALSFIAVKGEYATCYPYTGRTHYLRIHLQQLGCPIVNDPLYGGTQEAVMEQVYDMGANSGGEVYEFERAEFKTLLEQALSGLKGLRHLKVSEIVDQLAFPERATCYTCRRISEDAPGHAILENRDGRFYIVNYYRYIYKELYLSCFSYLVANVLIETALPSWFAGDISALKQRVMDFV